MRTLLPLVPLLLLACGDDKDSTETGDASFDVCAWIGENTPTELPAEDQVEVFCQHTTACDEQDRLITSQAVLDQAAGVCEDTSDMHFWEQVTDACDGGDGSQRDAVRCWRLD